MPSQDFFAGKKIIYFSLAVASDCSAILASGPPPAHIALLRSVVPHRAILRKKL
jgi:hypothetical protein